MNVHPPEELLGLRDLNTRVYKVVRDVEVIDPVTGDAAVQQVESRIVEKANNLCYQDEWGSFVPSVAEFEAVPGGFVADRNNFGVALGETLGDGLNATIGGVPVLMKPAYLLLFEGNRALTLAKADPHTPGLLDPQDPSVVRFPSAFGDLADLEYKVRKGGYHQNVIINEPIDVPSGFDSKSAQVLVYSEISYDDLVVNCGLRVSDINGAIHLSSLDSASQQTEEEITFEAISEGGTKVRLFSFAESDVWDSAGNREKTKRTVAAKQLFRSKDGITYLVERVDHSFLSSARHPVVVDYVVETGGMTEDETWTPPNTYYISGDLTVSNATLTVRPGTTVKYEHGVDASLKIESGGCIKAEGTAYDYITFTSKKDDCSGEDLTDTSTSGSRGDYEHGIYLAYSASISCVIKYCKIGYADDGISNYINSSSLAPIENNIIAHCSNGFYLFRPADVKNNLISDCSNRGILGYYYGQPGYTGKISNNTIDSCHQGIYCYYSSLTAKYNLFSNCYFAVYRQNGSVTLDYNGYYNNTWPNDVYGCDKGNNAVDNMTTSPYDTSPLGDFYLNDEDYGGALLKNKSCDSEMGFSGYVYTTEKPVIAPTTVSGGDTWNEAEKVDYETTTSVVDIGYHHNRVDRLLNNANTTVTSGTLTIEDGFVIAITGFKSLNMSTGGALVCEGDPWEKGYNIIARGSAVSAKIESPGARLVPNGYVYLSSSSSENTSIKYTRFRWLGWGLKPARSLTNEIQHNWFELCAFGCYSYNSSNTYNSNLYSGNVCGLHCYAGTNYSYNNTFDCNDSGLWFYKCMFYGGSMVVKDSLFTNNGDGIRRSGESGGLTHEHNAFHANGKNIYDAQTSQVVDIGSNSLVVVSSPYETGVSWGDRYRLNQECALIDAGSVTAASRELATFTTDKDDASNAIKPDIGQVDVGYHYPLVWSDPAWTSVSIDNPCFKNSVTFTVIYDPSSTEWALRIYSGELEVYDSGFSSGSSKTWEPSPGQSDGEYQYKIVRDVPGTTDDEFITGTIVRDRAAPGTLTISYPASGDTVRGH